MMNDAERLVKLDEIIKQIASRMGPRSHSYGCECGGFNHKGQWPCSQLTNAILDALDAAKDQPHDH